MLRPDRFTEQAQAVLADSQRLVQEYQQAQWDVEHVFLALVQQEKGVTGQVLQQLEIDGKEVQERLESVLAAGPQVAHPGGQMYVTPRIARLLENAENESKRLSDDFVGSEHLLIAVTMEREGETPRILRAFGIDQEKVYQALHKVRGSHRVTDPNAESHYRALGIERKRRKNGKKSEEGGTRGKTTENNNGD